ncbi:hypothetical protein [Nocardia paucivorans]|uniref:hypothetical protein n=1 Tax=Nocardia paucivorans TaxID=114259 RepID=UPI0002E08B4C|nr:hypothetical protein [Nocardia paucivorans]
MVSAPTQTDVRPKQPETLLGTIRSRLVPEAESAVRHHHPKWQWNAAFAVLGLALVLLVFFMMRSCSLPPPTAMTGPGGLGPVGANDGGAAALPGPLRTASCRSQGEGTNIERCVIDAGDPLLFGGITGGRALTFQVQRVQPGQLTQTIQQWRTAGGTVVADGEVFAAISASSAVLFADTASGLRVDTGSFTDRAGAQTFLVRSGLLQQ